MSIMLLDHFELSAGGWYADKPTEPTTCPTPPNHHLYYTTTMKVIDDDVLIVI